MVFIKGVKHNPHIHSKPYPEKKLGGLNLCKGGGGCLTFPPPRKGLIVKV